MNEPLSATLRDAVDFLQRHGVSYALIDDLAASVRGQPRLTADVDLVVAADVDRALDLIAALDQSAFEPLFPGVDEVVRRSFILPLKNRVTGVKVDIALGLSGFEQLVIARAEAVPMAATTVSVATAEDLLIMKTLAGRPRDSQDVEGLLAARGNTMDWTYCEQMARNLGEAIGQDLLTPIQVLRRDATS